MSIISRRLTEPIKMKFNIGCLVYIFKPENGNEFLLQVISKHGYDTVFLPLYVKYPNQTFLKEGIQSPPLNIMRLIHNKNVRIEVVADFKQELKEVLNS